MRLLVSGCTSTMSVWGKEAPDLLGHLTSPRARNKLDSLLRDGLPWAVDNWAFSGLDPIGFRRFLSRIRKVPGCLFVAVPDVVRHGDLTLELFWQWREQVAATGQPLAFVAHDGCESTDIPWDFFQVLFIGGSNEWRFSTHMLDVVGEARRHHKRLHLGRVNSFSNVQLAWNLRCDTCGGAGFSWFGETCIEAYVRWLRCVQSQREFFFAPFTGPLMTDRASGKRCVGSEDVSDYGRVDARVRAQGDGPAPAADD